MASMPLLHRRMGGASGKGEGAFMILICSYYVPIRMKIKPPLAPLQTKDLPQVDR